MHSLSARIAKRLRRDIVSGRLTPGCRLPKRGDLALRYDASLVTVQAAVQYLIDEGFLTVGARKRGTFVAERPPHLHHYKILFPHNPEYRSEFWRVLRNEATSMSAETDREFSFFYGLDGHRDIRSYQELLDDVQAQRVAGLIFASGAAEFKGTPILDQPSIPRVAIACDYELPGIPKLMHDYASFFRQAIEYLLAQGRQHIAVVFGASRGDSASVEAGGASIVNDFTSCMTERGLTVNPVWTQFVEVWSPMSARRCLHLMLHEGQRERPDGLILADDNFIPAATRGIVDAGVRVPDELSVVAMANFPVGIEAAVPVTRIGFDVKGLLEAAATAIDDLQHDREVPEIQEIAAVTEDEYGRRIEATHVRTCPETQPPQGKQRRRAS